MKSREFNQKPNFEPGLPNRKFGHFQVENFGYLIRLRYGVGLQMTLFSFISRASRVRAASKVFIPDFHCQFHGGSHPQGNKEVGDMVSAKSMYEKMVSFGCVADVVTFTSLIDGYCRIGDVNQSLQLSNAMKVRNISPNVYTFAITINVLCKENRLHEAREFLRELQCRNIVPKPFIFNPVIDGFCKAGNLNEANLIVVEMEEKKCHPDKVTFTILIIGHCMKGRMLEAISIFNKMLSVGCTPDDVTVRSLISCLMKAGVPNEASRIITIASQDMKLASSSSMENNAPLRINRGVPVTA
ncbi:hypothetical protein CRYUN_Cryun33cG0072300 [Craigia yunnanensis]